MRAERDAAYRYIREKLSQIRIAVNNAIPDADGLSDLDLIKSDHIGLLASSFETLLSDLSKTNERLRTVNADLTVAFDLIGEAVLVVDADFNIVAHNRLAFDQFGGGRDSIVYRRCGEVVCGREVGGDACVIRDCIRKRGRAERPNVSIGSKLYDIIGVPVFAPDGSHLHTVITYVDMTEHRKAMEAVARSEARYRDLFENVNDLIQVSDLDGRLLYVNRAWKATTGIPDPAGLTMDDLLPGERLEEFNRAVRRALAGSGNVRLETETRDAHGAPLLLDGNITCSPGEDESPLVRAIFRDVTRQRRLEEEIATTQRLDTVGQLAGGIAHDFNNVLTAILGNISLAKMYEEKGLSARDKLAKAENAVVRAKGLTRQLLTFATGGAPVKRALALGPFLTETVGFTLSGSAIASKFSIPDDLMGVEVDPGQLEQVIHNIVLNAVQAMRDGGTIRVEAANLRVDEKSGLALPQGDYVTISVIDTGVGIVPGHLDKIFDPFFTTKESGKGLGLATSFSIVRKHGGTITVQSTPGVGSRFDVHLPAVPGAEVEAEGRACAGQPRKAGGRILVMDDEPEIRSILESLLSHQGYEVVTVADGREAVAVYSAALELGQRFDLTIMDLTVPGGMGGDEAMKRMLELDPAIRAVVSSGYSSDPVMSDYARHGFAGVVVKPYRFETLTALVAELIGRGR